MIAESAVPERVPLGVGGGKGVSHLSAMAHVGEKVAEQVGWRAE